MGLLAVLRDLRTVRDLSARLDALQAQGEALARAVRDLEDTQVEREATFRKTRDDVLRYFKRIQELDRRGIEGQDAPRTAAIERVLALKYPKNGGS